MMNNRVLVVLVAVIIALRVIIVDSACHLRELQAYEMVVGGALACVPATRYDVIGYCVRCSPRLSCTKPKVRHG